MSEITEGTDLVQFARRDGDVLWDEPRLLLELPLENGPSMYLMEQEGYLILHDHDEGVVRMSRDEAVAVAAAMQRWLDGELHV